MNGVVCVLYCSVLYMYVYVRVCKQIYISHSAGCSSGHVFGFLAPIVHANKQTNKLMSTLDYPRAMSYSRLTAQSNFI